MEVLDLLKGASELVYKAVKDMAGTDEAGGDFGIGAGGDVSRNIDIIAEKTVINYVKENGFDCTILGEECGKVEIGKEPKGFLIMDAIDGSTNAVRGVPFFLLLSCVCYREQTLFCKCRYSSRSLKR